MTPIATGPDAALAAVVFSALAAVGNIALFLSQVPLMRRIGTERDSRQFSALPSLTLMVTMSLWSAYAVFVIPTVELLVANFSGVIIPLAYLCIFIVYDPTALGRAQLVGLTALALAAPWGIAIGIFFGGAPNPGNVLGWVTAAVNCSFFVAPLKQLRDAVRKRNIARVPTLLTCESRRPRWIVYAGSNCSARSRLRLRADVQIGQGATWMVAALLLGDPFILGVNTIGEAAALLQLGIIVYVKRSSGPLTDGDAVADAGKESPVELVSCSSKADDLGQLEPPDLPVPVAPR